MHSTLVTRFLPATVHNGPPGSQGPVHPTSTTSSPATFHLYFEFYSRSPSRLTHLHSSWLHLYYPLTGSLPTTSVPLTCVFPEKSAPRLLAHTFTSVLDLDLGGCPISSTAVATFNSREHLKCCGGMPSILRAFCQSQDHET